MVQDISTNTKEFLTAAEYVKKIKQDPSDDELLALYGLYKQATMGDNTNKQPGLFDIKGKKKWTAWENRKGNTRMQSEIEYITLVNTLIKKYGIKK